LRYFGFPVGDCRLGARLGRRGGTGSVVDIRRLREPTFVGAVTGAVWAFVDGFIAGLMLAWFYNKLATRHR
jgi:hypothetical protein